MGDYIAYKRGMKAGDVHPVIAGMNTLGYEAGTLGNHEFNYGVEFLDLVNAGANFPIVCANFASKPGRRPARGRAAPEALRDPVAHASTDGAGAPQAIKVGLIGFVPPQIMLWDRGHLEGKFQTRDILEAASAWVPEMREAGADIVVALSHSGIDAAADATMAENASLQLAAVEGIDAVVTGHQHRVWPSEDFAGEGIDLAKGTLERQAGGDGGLLGLAHGADRPPAASRTAGSWKVVGARDRARARSTSATRTAASPRWSATTPRRSRRRPRCTQATLEYVRAEVGTSTAPLQSYFAVVADDPSVQIVSQAQTWYVTDLLKGTEWEGLPVLSAAAPFKSGGRGGPDYYTDVPAGPIAIKNVADVYLYPNTLQAVAITGAQVKDWLERSAGIFNQITAGRRRPAADRPGLPRLQLRRHRRRHLRDRRDPAGEVRRRRQAGEPGRQPHRRPEVRRPADRPGGALRRRDQQLPRRRRRQLPRRRRLDGDPRGARHQPRRHRALHRRAGHHLAQRRRQLEAGAGRRGDGHSTTPARARTAYLEDVRARGLAIEPAGDAPDGFLRYRITL